MSVRVSAWVWEHSRVEHRGDLLVLLALADHAHDDGSSAYPSVDTLSKKARLSRRGTFEALRRLKEVGAISPEGKGPRGTVAYRVHMDPVQSLHGADAAPVQSDAPGGAVTSTVGVQSPAPEPSLEPSERNRPPARAGARGALPLPDDLEALSDTIAGVLQRGIDGITSSEPMKRARPADVLRVLRELQPTPDVAYAVAVDTRATTQAQNRAPNVVGLYRQKLARATAEAVAA